MHMYIQLAIQKTNSMARAIKEVLNYMKVLHTEALFKPSSSEY